MQFNFEIYSGILNYDAMTKSYIIPQVVDFIDDNLSASFDKSMVTDQLYAINEMLYSEYFKQTIACMKNAITDEVNAINDCEISLISMECYDFHVIANENSDPESLAGSIFELATQGISDFNEDLAEEIRLATKSIVNDFCDKEFDLQLSSDDIYEGMELISSFE